MSICIAAKNPARVPCREVVVCCDTKVSTESLSAETGKGKLHLLGPRWCVLTAGLNPSIDEVVSIFKASLPDLKDKHPLESLRVTFRKWRSRIAEAFIHDRHAITMEQFYGHGKVWFDSETWKETQNQLAATYESRKLEVEMILIGCVGGSLSIYRIYRGDIVESDSFAMIGSGSVVGEAAFYWRIEHDAIHDLEQTIYASYEAKKLSELSPFVGEQTLVIIVERTENGGLSFDRGKSVDTRILDAKLKRFGLKPHQGKSRLIG